MRTILSRGKRTDSNEWVRGAALRTADGYYIFRQDKSYSVRQDTIGQYTGLDDKNGKPIYEGDIVTTMSNGEKITGWIVRSADASFYLDLGGLHGYGLNRAECWAEVIGNIHDNPKLLEAG